MGQKHSDIDRIKELIDIMKENELTELEIEHGEDKIVLKRSMRFLLLMMISLNL